jgi:endonuclease G
MTIWTDARTLVGEGETETALDLVESFLKGRLDGVLAKRVRQLLDTAIMLKARIRRRATASMRGLLTTTEADVERARQDLVLLELISEIEAMDTFRAPSASINPPIPAGLEKLMGAENQMRSTGWLKEGLRMASAVCRLTDQTTFGSGFRCREDAILTNHHVIARIEEAVTFRAEFLFEEDAFHKLGAPLSVALEPQRLFWTSQNLDVTLVGIAKFPRTDITVIPLIANHPVNVDDHVSIIQHPSGGPKQIAVTNNRILNIYGQYMHYTTDTLPGSSGSPVFADSWRVIAIHHAGGNMQKNARGDVIFANEGILINAILANDGFQTIYSSPAQ